MKIKSMFRVINEKEKEDTSLTSMPNYNKNGSENKENNQLNEVIKTFNKDEFDIFKFAENLGAIIKYDSDKKPKPLSNKVMILVLSEYIIETFKDYNIHLYQIDEKAPIFLFNGIYWNKLDLKEFQHIIKDITLNLGIPPIKAKDKYFNEKLSEQILHSVYNKEIKNNSNNLINLQNGTFDLNTMKLKPFDYRDFLKYQLDYKYNPKAVNHLWIRFLDEILPNKDTQKTLQEVIGSIFIKSIKLEYSFFFYGSGANGKSVIMEVLKGILGKDNLSYYSLSDLKEEHNIADLQDRLLNISSENSKELQADIFKKLASNEDIKARYKYDRGSFFISNYAKSIYLVNDLNFNNIEHTDGFFRRFLIIPFNVTISPNKRDKNLHKKILQNKAGVLNWIIEGAKRVLQNEDIFISKECEDVKIEFMNDVDSVVAFMNDYYKYHFNEYTHYKKIYLKEFHNLYLKFCNDNGFKYPAHIKTLSKRLLSISNEFNIIKSRDMNGTYFEITKK